MLLCVRSLCNETDSNVSCTTALGSDTARSVGGCEAALSWQVSAASAMVLAVETHEEEAHGAAMEQAEGSAER